MSAYTDSNYMDKYGDSGILQYFGKDGMKTPGEFSHDSNPIDLVKDGEKIGEATGGEYIFNPTQSKKMKELASKEKSPLAKYVVGLLNKFDKKAE